MRSASRALAFGVLMWLGATTGATAQIVQESVNLEIVQAIRDEGLLRSEIEDLAGYLTDVIGPRLTGSPAMYESNVWTAETLRGWGLENVIVEPWGEFGRGWQNLSFSGRIVAPYVQILNALPVAWTAGTNGMIAGKAMIVKADSVADLQRYTGQLKNAFVLMQEPPVMEPEYDPQPLRSSLDELLRPPPAQAERDQNARRRRMAEWRRQRALRDSINDFLTKEGIAAAIYPSSRTYGILRVFGMSNARDPETAIPGPALVVSHEQYGQIYRNVQRDLTVRLEVRIENEFYDDDLMAYNTLGDIPGTDKADEYVMLGAHLDSWYPGTGATDNAAGTVVMMEAVRILKALDLKPRRTVRIALWSGEEQGLLGSRGWVNQHPDLWPMISAYVNVDNGTGRIRGIWDQENEAAIGVFEQILWPFTDLGVVAVKHGNTGGTDHLAFDAVGIPGFNFIQDPIEYSTRTHHTFADRYERLVIDDLKQAAVVVAATVYHLAVRDEMMPRKPRAEETATH